jgi:hypothetical protein
MLRRRSARRRERGAVALEAALVTPFLILLVFGIIEFSLLMRDYVAVSSSARVGGRIASASAGAGPGTCPTGPSAPPCTPATAPAFAQAAADAIAKAGTALPKDEIDYIWVYEANSNGLPGTATSLDSATCSVSCVKYTWSTTDNAFRYNSGSWQSSSVNACVNDTSTTVSAAGNTGTTVVGVYLKAHHNWLTGMFGTTKSMSDRAVMKFEPLTYDVCKPGAHT